MRLPQLAPEALSPELRPVHDEITALLARMQGRIVVRNEQGALIGPFPAMLHFPQFGVPALLFHRSLSAEARLPKTVREVAILTVGAAFGARYELYAHEITAADVGLSQSQIATLAAGGRPSNLSDEEALARYRPRPGFWPHHADLDLRPRDRTARAARRRRTRVSHWRLRSPRGATERL